MVSYVDFFMFLLRSFIYLLCLAGVASLIQLEGFELQQNALYSEETLTEHRLVHGAIKLELKGESMRKKLNFLTDADHSS